MSKDTDLGDRNWFVLNPGKNLRIRKPDNAREVVDLIRTLEPRVAGCAPRETFECPPGSSWRVAVIRVARAQHIRLLILHRDGDAEPESGDGWRLCLLHMGDRVALDHF